MIINNPFDLPSLFKPWQFVSILHIIINNNKY